ncbi:MAG: hypothetical protein KAV87_26310 [Desulfobacteraceae bacterium]|nr:hypothetical protein [Desulfobacteraceae bacterium]
METSSQGNHGATSRRKILCRDPLYRTVEGTRLAAPRRGYRRPYLTERDSFRDVPLTNRLKTALKAINLDEHGKQWLDDERVSQIVSSLERISAPKLMEANKAVFDLLVNGLPIAGNWKTAGGRDRTAKVIDFEKPGAK